MVLALLLAMAACATDQGAPTSLTPIAFDRIPGWATDATETAFSEFRGECDRLSAAGASDDLGGSGELAQLAGRPADYATACFAARQVLVSTSADARRFFEHFFAAYDAGPVRVTGYFEPEFRGSLTQGGIYQTPILARPPDLVTVRSPNGGTISGRPEDGRIVPYPTRAEIDRGALAGRGLELLWLADPVDLYFLQIEGSGRILLPSGQTVRIAYAGKNGQPYVPLGRVMIDRGLLAPADATQAHIRDWLEDNPSRARSLMEANPNYVFFRVRDVPPDEGAPGALGVPLSPLRSVAVEPARIPLGLPVFVDVPTSSGQLRTLALATDVSADHDLQIFFGWGETARRRAGLRTEGHIVLLLPRPARQRA